jgi:hypothetical protein
MKKGTLVATFLIIALAVIIALFVGLGIIEIDPNETPTLPLPFPENIAENVFVIDTSGQEFEVTVDNITDMLTKGAYVEVRENGRLFYNSTSDSNCVRIIDINEPATFRIITTDYVTNGTKKVQNFNIQPISGLITFDIRTPLSPQEHFVVLVNKRIEDTYEFTKWAIPVTGTLFRVDVTLGGDFSVLFYEGEALLYKDNVPEAVLNGGLVAWIKDNNLNVEAITKKDLDGISDHVRKVIDNVGGEDVIIARANNTIRSIDEVLAKYTTGHFEEHLMVVNEFMDNFGEINNDIIVTLIEERNTLRYELSESKSQLNKISVKISTLIMERDALQDVSADNEEEIKLLNESIEHLTQEKVELENIIKLSEGTLANNKAQLRRELEHALGELDDTIILLNNTLSELDSTSSEFKRVSSNLSSMTIERDKISAELITVREEFINAMLEAEKKLTDTLAQHEEDLTRAEMIGDERVDEIRAEMEQIVAARDTLLESLYEERDNLKNDLIREQEERTNDFEKMRSDISKAISDGDARAMMLENRLKNEHTRLIESYEAILAIQNAELAELAEHITHYQAVVDRHKETEALLALYRDLVEERDFQIERIKNQNDAAIADANTTITRLETELVRQKEANQLFVDRLTEEISDLRILISARNRRVEELEDSIHVLTEAYERRIDELTVTIDKLLESNELNDNELRHALTEAYRIIDQLKVQHAAEVARISKKLESRIVELEHQVVGLQKLIDAGVIGQDDILAELVNTKTKLTAAENELILKDRVIEELRNELTERNKEIEALLDKNVELILEIEELLLSNGSADEIKELQNQIAILRTELEEKSNRLHDLEEELEWALTQISNIDFEKVSEENKALRDYVIRIGAWLNELDEIIQELPPGHQQPIKNWVSRMPRQ